MSGPATLGHLRQLVQAGVRRNQQAFRTSEDDWMAMAFVQSPGELSVLGLSGELFGRDKDALAEWLRQTIVQLGAIRYALLLNGYGYQAEALDDYQRRILSGELRVSEVPVEAGRQEHLWLVLGDAESEEGWISDIGFDARGIRRAGPWREQGEWISRFAGLNEYLRRGAR